jgi:hypothetical protein
LQRVPKKYELRFTSNERGTGGPRAQGARDDVENAIGALRTFLPLEGERGERLGADRIPGQAVGRVADQDLPRTGAALETLGGVDGVARDQRVAPTRVAHDHLARVDPDANGDAFAEQTLELDVQEGQRVSHLCSRAYRPERIVLMQDRCAEDGHDRVADELADGAAVTLEDGGHLIEVPRHEPAHPLRILPLAKRRGPDDVAEDDGHGLPDLARRRDR